MRDFSRRLNEADAMFLAVEKAAGVPYAPLGITIWERSYTEVAPGALEHVREVQARLLPAMRRRVVKDRFSTALPRWADVPDYDLNRQSYELPLPGDGSLRAILDWAAEFATTPWDPELAPWRTVYFPGFEYEGRPGCMAMVSQTHHSIVDGEGGKRIGRRLLQFEPDGPLPEMPPPVPPEDITAFGRWLEGWAHEWSKLRQLLRNNARRAAWAARHPRAGLRRTKELAGALRRMRKHQAGTSRSPLLQRRSTRLHFEVLTVPLSELKAGGKAVGGTVNDALLGALSIGLHRYHRDHGVGTTSLRTTMAVNTRRDDHPEGGNQVVAVMLELPLLDDARDAVTTAAEVSRAHRNDKDVVWIIDRLRALANRLPRRLVVPEAAKTLKNMDLQISNLPGNPFRVWIAGVESLRGFSFPTAGPGLAMIFSGARNDRATLAISTDPEAIRDPEHLVDRLREAFDEVIALGADGVAAAAD